ncbi:MAG TPA: MBL fold metallo-hydrolase, partial [Gammaproteobacteria bacterium]|nr:MBL fold metallo-hydrolase [Gammaproteobacteria bacterium]
MFGTTPAAAQNARRGARALARRSIGGGEELVSLSRRTLLRLGAHGAAALSLGLVSRSTWAQTPSAPVDLGGGFRVLPAGKTNVLAVTGREGTALVDGGSAADSAALLARVAALPGAGKVHTLFNTHWHPEQVGSNEAVGKAGGVIFAHEKTKLMLSHTTYNAIGFKDRIPARPEAARPTRVVRSDGTMDFAGQQVRYGYMPAAHTDGD